MTARLAAARTRWAEARRSLARELESFGWEREDIASFLDVSLKTVHEYLAEQQRQLSHLQRITSLAAEARRQAHRGRLEDYQFLRADGASRAEITMRLGISVRTMLRYDRELREEAA